MSEPTTPHDWFSIQFEDAAFWRDQAERWETLGNMAENDGDHGDASRCRANAAGCRRHARSKDLSQ